MNAQRTEMMTRDGVRVIRTAAPFDPAELGRVAALADERRGGVMSSGMEYPGRYSRWHMAYADPCLEITAAGRQITARARGGWCGRFGASGPDATHPGGRRVGRSTHCYLFATLYSIAIP